MTKKVASARGVQWRLSTLISVVARRWRRAVDKQLQPFDLTEASWVALVRLSRSEVAMRQKDLAADLMLDSSSVVRILGNLEKAGLIERREMSTDHRAKALVVTLKGGNLVKQVESVSANLERELLSEFPKGEIETARRVVNRMAILLREREEKHESLQE